MGGQPKSLVGVPGYGNAASKYNGKLSSISKISIIECKLNDLYYYMYNESQHDDDRDYIASHLHEAGRSDYSHRRRSGFCEHVGC